jgi:hypothetical protein
VGLIIYILKLYRVEKGYAIVNVDARGTWNSEGNMYFWGNNVRMKWNFLFSLGFYLISVLGCGRWLRYSRVSCKATLV